MVVKAKGNKPDMIKQLRAAKPDHWMLSNFFFPNTEEKQEEEKKEGGEEGGEEEENKE